MEQELVIKLDDPYWKTATITPISFRLDGTSLAAEQRFRDYHIEGRNEL